eukprot:c12224_g1_i1.p2 GENE.c12224_g1_i1~~c12224_g1_i1.p2  ORF type:complete len:505 (-),score=106.67 c12224_g1_i1:2164-3639(-)
MSDLQEAFAQCQRAIRAFDSRQNASANDFNVQGRILLDFARTTLAAAVDTFKAGLQSYPGDDALQRGLDEALFKGQGSRVDAILDKMDTGFARCMQLAREIRSAAVVPTVAKAQAIVPLNVLLISANTGSCFEGDDLEQAFLQVLHQQLNSSNADLAVIHFQEMCGKEWKTRDVKATCDDFIAKLRGGLSKFWSPGAMFYPPANSNDNSFTALATIIFVRHLVVDSDRLGLFDFVKGQEVALSAIEDNSVLDSFIHHESFPSGDYPEIKAGRKGYLHIRVVIDGMPVDLINLHLFHDATNVQAFSEGHPSSFARARKRALSYVMRQCGITFASNTFVFGDFNFRLDLQSVVHELLGPNLVSEEEGDNLVLSSPTSAHTLRLGPKRFNYSEPQQFIEHWQRFQTHDAEGRGNFVELQLQEQPIRFPPSYPFEEEVGKPHEYMPSRCPGWCDRIAYTASVARAISSPTYDVLGYDQSVGDHKPILLKFAWKVQ